MTKKRSKSVQPKGKDRQVAGYGWIPDLPDARDYLFGTRRPLQAALPSSVDLRVPLFTGRRPGTARQLYGQCPRRRVGVFWK